MKIFPTLATSAALVSFSAAAPVTNEKELIEVVNAAAKGAVIELAEGRYELAAPLEIKGGITLKGAGIGKTILTHTPGWRANPSALPDPETNFKKFDKSGYLMILQEKGEGITVSEMTLTGPQVHGGIYGWGNRKLHLHNLRFEDFMYSGF